MKKLLFLSLLYGAISLTPKPHTHNISHKTNSPNSQHMHIQISHYCTKCHQFFGCIERVPKHKCEYRRWHKVTWKCDAVHQNCKGE